MRPRYDRRVPEPEPSPTHEVDVGALFARLQEEVRKGAVLTPEAAQAAPQARLSARAEAERLWPVTAERPLERRTGIRGAVGRFTKKLTRKLMRWYVEPVVADQRAFNDALLKLIDDLEERVAELERRP
jgi:hypothetical protein